jgi:hypothetical protein
MPNGDVGEAMAKKITVDRIEAKFPDRAKKKGKKVMPKMHGKPVFVMPMPKTTKTPTTKRIFG